MKNKADTVSYLTYTFDSGFVQVVVQLNPIKNKLKTKSSLPVPEVNSQISIVKLIQQSR